MSKSVLVIDAPESCSKCKIGHDMSICIICPIANKVALNEKAEAVPDWCPLKPLPEKGAIENDMTDYQCGMVDGRNQCIDEITGGEVDGEINKDN